MVFAGYKYNSPTDGKPLPQDHSAPTNVILMMKCVFTPPGQATSSKDPGKE